MNQENRCDKKGCLREKADDSEYCPIHKPKPWEKHIADDEEETDEYPDKEFVVTTHFSGEIRTKVEAQTEDEAMRKARDVRDYSKAEITEPELHTEIEDHGEVEDQDHKAKSKEEIEPQFNWDDIQ